VKLTNKLPWSSAIPAFVGKLSFPCGFCSCLHFAGYVVGEGVKCAGGAEENIASK
jgi:hypothetical protein